MKVTIHAAERLLQRVFGMRKYTRRDIQRARKLLEREVKDIMVVGVKRIIPLPSFDNAVAVYHDNAIVTIYPKDFVKAHRKAQRHAA